MSLLILRQDEMKWSANKIWDLTDVILNGFDLDNMGNIKVSYRKYTNEIYFTA